MILRALSLISSVGIALVAAYHVSIGRLDWMWAVVIVGLLIGLGLHNFRRKSI